MVRAGEPDSAAKALGIGRGKPVLERGPETSDVVGDGASIVRGGLAQNGSVLGRDPLDGGDAAGRKLARVRDDAGAKDRGALAHTLVSLDFGEANNWIVGLVLDALSCADGRGGAGSEHVELALRSRKHLSIVELGEKFG